MRLLSLILAAVLPAFVGAAGHAAGPAMAPGKAATPDGFVVPARADGVSLVMVDDPACTYCIRWNKEVGRGYARTAEGRAAPLRRVRRNAGVLSSFAPVVYTPTFILVRNGREVGRITGYPGQLHFWEELSGLMSAAGIAKRG